MGCKCKCVLNEIKIEQMLLFIKLNKMLANKE
jgi:hypothetical protein